MQLDSPASRRAISAASSTRWSDGHIFIDDAQQFGTCGTGCSLLAGRCVTPGFHRVSGPCEKSCVTEIQQRGLQPARIATTSVWLRCPRPRQLIAMATGSYRIERWRETWAPEIPTAPDGRTPSARGTKKHFASNQRSFHRVGTTSSFFFIERAAHVSGNGKNFFWEGIVRRAGLKAFHDEWDRHYQLDDIALSPSSFG